jgi:hypothetical protein
VSSGARDPRFGDETTVPERTSCIVEVVDDVIQGFCWEAGIRHRGFREDGIAPVRRSVDCVNPDSPSLVPRRWRLRLSCFPSSSPSEIRNPDAREPSPLTLLRIRTISIPGADFSADGSRLSSLPRSHHRAYIGRYREERAGLSTIMLKGRGAMSALGMKNAANVFIELILADQAAGGFPWLRDDGLWVLLVLGEPPDPR